MRRACNHERPDMAMSADHRPIPGQRTRTAGTETRLLPSSQAIGVYGADSVVFDARGFWEVTVEALTDDGEASANTSFEAAASSCRTEMPDLQAVHRSLGPEIQAIGLNNRDSRRVARRLLAETSVTNPSGFGPGGRIAAAYEIVGMPATVFIDADGVISTRTGALSERGLRRRIEERFGVR